MADKDWKTIGLKCGLEIHQQIEGKKLFCKCPTEIRDQDPHYTTKRKLRAVAGEEGVVDIAALHEMKKGKTFAYESYQDTTCLVELDETPPEVMNEQALEVALQVSLMLECRIVDQVHVMRKTVVDGSNTSGFQRTALVASNGKLTTPDGEVTIEAVSIEEDSARQIKSTADFTLFRLDRLGIPLIEIGTGSEIRTPTQAKEVAETLGLILRSTGKAKRGLGTIRQDVNVSIKGGQRVEIKGAQDLKTIPLLIKYEAERQQSLIDIKNELSDRNITRIEPKIEEVTHILAKSESEIIKNTLKKKGVVMAIKLEGFAGILGKETQPGKRFGTELSDRAKQRAGVGGLFHSDELPKYGIEQSEVEAINQALGCTEQDGFVLIADQKEKVSKSLQAVIERARMALNGVVKEVRKANPDSTTSFIRPMPGAARMYPETDVPAITLTKEFISKIKLPERIEDKTKRYVKIGLGQDLAFLVAKSPKSEFFEHLLTTYSNIKPAYLAETLMGAAKTIKRQHNIEVNLTEEDFETLFRALDGQDISKESVIEILKQNKPVESIIDNYKVLSDEEIEKELQKIIAKNKDVPFNALIGEAMSQLRGKASGQKIAELLKKLVS